jgi:glycosyltransferase involved in cell wall biosynthesis
MQFTIITPTYNSAATVEDTLQSIAAQDHAEVEHIVMDGGSTDGTLGIVGRYGHVARVISGRDRGIYDAMNKGIAASSGEVIAFLNSDDFYAHSGVLGAVAAVFKGEMADAVYGDLQYVSDKDVKRVVRHWKAGVYRADAFKWGWMPPHPSFFVRREVFERLGGFNLDMSTAADYELMLRFIHKYRIRLAYIPEVLVKMRTGGASNASFGARWRANRKDKEAWSVNELTPFWFTLQLKPIRKLTQYILK